MRRTIEQLGVAAREEVAVISVEYFDGERWRTAWADSFSARDEAAASQKERGAWLRAQELLSQSAAAAKGGRPVPLRYRITRADFRMANAVDPQCFDITYIADLSVPQEERGEESL